MKLQAEKGATVKESTKNRIEYNRIKFNRMSSEREQNEYLKKCDEKIVSYELHPPNTTLFFEISKTEYGYFQSLLIEQDVEDNMATEENTWLKFGKSSLY